VLTASPNVIDVASEVVCALKSDEPSTIVRVVLSDVARVTNVWIDSPREIDVESAAVEDVNVAVPSTTESVVASVVVRDANVAVLSTTEILVASNELIVINPEIL
jgi:hypothetical protein